MKDSAHTTSRSDEKNDRLHERPRVDPGSADELDEADGAMEAPTDAFRSREEIEKLRIDEGPGPEPHEPHRVRSSPGPAP